MLGLGVMLGILGGNERTVNAVKGSLGKVIRSVVLDDNTARVRFEDGPVLELWDDGQSCCESRWMETSEKLAEFVGARLLDVSIKSAPDLAEEHGAHEVQFLELSTDRGAITFSNHNQHNGYYGGFHVVAARSGGNDEDLAVLKSQSPLSDQ